MTDSKLKPCPFCGGEAEKMTSSDGFTSIGCLNCNPLFGIMVQRSTEAEAVEAWNTRAERTCQDTNEDEHDFTCSECGASMYVQVDDTWTMIGAGGFAKDVLKRPSHCPNCGARVIA